MKDNKPSYLPNSVDFNSAKNSDKLASDLCARIGEILNETINKNGRASIAVSGGSTPILLFQKLSMLSIDWMQVDLTLVDDRWLEPTHSDSNELLVRTHLIKNNAIHVNFIPLKNKEKSASTGKNISQELIKAITLPFDIIILGMGNDGHTASLFPCCDELFMGMDLNNSDCLIATNPKTAPYERISLTARVIGNARNIFLHLNGSSKIETLKIAMGLKDAEKMPIYYFLEKGLTLYFSE